MRCIKRLINECLFRLLIWMPWNRPQAGHVQAFVYHFLQLFLADSFEVMHRILLPLNIFDSKSYSFGQSITLQTLLRVHRRIQFFLAIVNVALSVQVMRSIRFLKKFSQLRLLLCRFCPPVHRRLKSASVARKGSLTTKLEIFWGLSLPCKNDFRCLFTFYRKHIWLQ